MNIAFASTIQDVPEVSIPISEDHPTTTPPTSVSSVSVCPVNPRQSVSICPVGLEMTVQTIDQAIAAAAPVRERNDRQLFLLARALLAVELHIGRKLSPAELLDVFDLWYKLGMSKGQLDPAKSREDYLTKFLSKKSKARKPLGPVFDFEAALAELSARPLPPEADYFQSHPIRRLVGLCKLLQEYAGDAPFCLSCRKAGPAIGLKHSEAAQHLTALVGLGLLTEVSKGRGIIASRYRFNPQPTDHL